MRQITAMSAEVVAYIDWWENGMTYLGQQFSSHEPLRFHIADTTNRAAFDRPFAEYSPDVFFYAGAYKHVPLMEENPIAAVNDNIGGSLKLMEHVIRHGVKNFVMVSTVMEALHNQIAAKQPLTVTRKDITRFFLTLDEASHLIIQSALAGANSDIFVLDMGEPAKIIDFPKSLVHAVGPTLEIKIIELRPGEKVYEELSYEPDKVGRTTNPKISSLVRRLTSMQASS